MFSAWKNSPYRKERVRQNEFKELEWYPMLFSSHHLNYMYDQAKSKADYEAILGHLYKFGEVTEDVPSYCELEQKIIDKYRRD